MKLFFLFFGKSRPSLFRNKGRIAFFFSFFYLLLLFFVFFWKCSSSGRVETISKTNLFFSLSSYPGPVWLEMKLEWHFLIFEIYYYFFGFFWKCSTPGRVETEWRFWILWVFLLSFLNFFRNALAWVKQKRYQNEFFFSLFLPVSTRSS